MKMSPRLHLSSGLPNLFNPTTNAQEILRFIEISDVYAAEICTYWRQSLGRLSTIMPNPD